jgi:HK97 family phage portal protein
MTPRQLLDMWRRKAQGQAIAKQDSPLRRLYPELRGREHMTPGRVDLGNILDDYLVHAHLYRSYIWLRKAILAKLNAIAPLPIRVVDRDGVPLVDHPLASLLAQPNDQDSSAELWGETFIHKDLGGEYFLEVVDDQRGFPAQLWARRPDTMVIFINDARRAYPAPALYVSLDLQNVGAGDLPPSAVIHERYPNPLSDWRGLSLISAARLSIDIDQQAQRYSANTLRNQARPDYAVTTELTLSDDERDRVMEILAARYAGNNDLPLVLESGQTIMPISWAPKDTLWLEQREMARDEIAAIIGVPDELMGYGRDTYENFETALKVLWLQTLLPMAQGRDDTLTRFFTQTRPILRNGERIATDFSGVSVLQEAIGPKIEQAMALFAMGVPFNVIDRTLKLGIGEIEGGETGFLSAGLIAVRDLIAPLPAPTPTPPSEAALGEIFIKALKAERKATQEKAIAREVAKLRRIRRSVEPRMAEALGELFAGWGKEMTAILEQEKAKPAQVTKEIDADALYEQLALIIDDAALEAVIAQWSVVIAQESWEVFNTILDMDITFEQSDPAVVATLAQAGDRVRGITDMTRTALRELLQFGAENAWSVGELMRGRDGRAGIRQTVEQTYRNRDKAIARTELGFAQNTATTARYEAAGVTRVKVLDNGVEDSDPRCRELAGSTQTLEWAKANPLQHPNCLRAFSPVFDED